MRAHFLLLPLLLSACAVPQPEDGTAPAATSARAQSVPTWSLQYEGKIIPRGKDYHVVDLFDVSDADIALLKSQGTKPIAYFSSQYENWRRDSNQFLPSDLGNNLDNWPGERWVNPHSAKVRQIMLNRMDDAKRRGFYGVDLDNVDFYEFSNGFGSTESDAADYVRFLASAAHSRGLKYALKNATNIIPATASVVDLYINEQAHQYNETSVYRAVRKPVFNIEYHPLPHGTPGMYTIYKSGAVMDAREVVVPVH